MLRTTITTLLWFSWMMPLSPVDSWSAETQQADSNSLTKSYLVSCHSGSLLTLEIPDQSLQWIDLSTPGRMLKKTIQLNEIRQAIICREAVGTQIGMIRKWLDELKGDDYLAREAAENELVKSGVGGRFRSIIEAEQEHAVLEVRYRVQRILTELDKREAETGGAFDQIQLQDGTWHMGDLGDFVMKCRYRDQSLKLTRAEVSFFDQRSGTEPRVESKSAQRVDIKVTQRHDEEWKGPRLTKLDFQFAPNGEPLATRSDVSEVFVPKGLLMRTEKPGYVGISGYAFRAECPPKENSICVFESVGTAFQRFKGVMVFRFCMPNQPEVAAGVHQFGLWVSRVDEPRDFILEAYNAEGHLLGTVEASDANCTFHGIRSSEPIVQLRLLSNPYLFSLNRKVDEDYCVDDLHFSEPVPLPYLRDDQQSGIMISNGDCLMGNLRIREDEVGVTLTELGPELPVPMTDIRSLSFGNRAKLVSKGQRVWHAMLRDRSIVAVDPSAKFQARWFGQQRIDRSSISALWLAPNQLRYPLAEDLAMTEVRRRENGSRQAIMVFPTCRIITSDLKLDDRGYAWSEFLKQEQDLWLRQAESRESEDTGPSENAIEFVETSAEKIPSLWLKNPPDWQPELGLIRLTDGQQFVIGGAEGIEITGLDKAAVTLRWGQAIESLPLSIIEYIDFGTNKK